MADELLTIGGVYIFQSNAIFVNSLDASLNAEISIANQIKQGKSSLNDWRTLTYLLALRHEENHFLNFLTSPYLSFLDYLNELYASNFNHMVKKWLPSRGDIISQPIYEIPPEDLEPEIRVNVAMMSSMRDIITELLFRPTTVNNLVESLNFALKSLAYSKGLNPTDIMTVSTKLPEETLIGNGRYYTLNIIEALARMIEWYSIYELGASRAVQDDWMDNKIWGQYRPAFEAVLTYAGTDLGAIALNLSLRGRFFPFVGPGEILIEDFHPVLLLDRILNIVPTFLSKRSKSAKPFISLLTEGELVEFVNTIVSQFDLITDPTEFQANEDALDSRFAEEFPEIANHEGYRLSKKEKDKFQIKRSKYYEEFNKNPLCLFEKPIVSVD